METCQRWRWFVPVNETTAAMASAGIAAVTRKVPLLDCAAEEGGTWRMSATASKATKVVAVFKACVVARAPRHHWTVVDCLSAASGAAGDKPVVQDALEVGALCPMPQGLCGRSQGVDVGSGSRQSILRDEADAGALGGPAG